MKTVGVIGGMGPKATIDFLNKVIYLTPAQKDQDHIKIIVYMNPQIPDRTKAICKEGKSPRLALIDSAKRLESAGVDFIVIPCVTAHFWLRDIQESIARPIIDLVEVTLTRIRKMRVRTENIGILATTGVIRARIFNDTFKAQGFNLISPDNDIQTRCVMKGIYAIKKGAPSIKVKRLFLRACKHLAVKGAGIIVGACTEIPLVITDKDIKTPLVDINQALAEETVRQACSSLACKTG